MASSPPLAGLDPKGRPIYRDVIAPNSFTIRQELITAIEKQLDASLIIYTANLGTPGSGIMIQDAVLFEDLLRSVSDSKKGVLMITSAGGDPNAAEKLMQMCRKRFTEGFQIIVPFYAKSAATLMCLGADKICMGYGAELGPIDPQIQIAAGSRPIPARAFIDGLEAIRERVRQGDPVTMYYPMLQQIKPEVIAICQTAIEDSRTTAERWLKDYMLKDDPAQAKNVAKLLSEGQTYKSHGKPIDFRETHDILKLKVDELDNGSPLWQQVWEVFTRSTAFLQQSGFAKLFESRTVSLGQAVSVLLEAPAQQPQRPPPQPQPRQEQPQRGERPST